MNIKLFKNKNLGMEKCELTAPKGNYVASEVAGEHSM